MFIAGTHIVNGKPVTIVASIRQTENPRGAIQYWMARLARDTLRIGVYLRAVALWYRIPGTGRYRWRSYDDVDDNAPNSDEDPARWLDGADRFTLLNVLADCLRRLRAEWVLRDVPGGRKFRAEGLSEEWTAYLDRLAGFENGILSVVAQCLDQLIVYPGMAELHEAPHPTWWQKWWARMD
jgi:hypothetical protein